MLTQVIHDRQYETCEEGSDDRHSTIIDSQSTNLSDSRQAGRHTMMGLKGGAATTVHTSLYFGYTGQAKLEQTQFLSLKVETVHGGHQRSVCPRRLASPATPMWEPRILQLFYIFILKEGSFTAIWIIQEVINKISEQRKGRNENSEGRKELQKTEEQIHHHHLYFRFIHFQV